MKLLELIQSTAAYFVRHGVDSPRLTIELMLAELLGMTRMQLYLEFEREMTPEELDRLRPWVKQRSEGIPLQHLLGHVEFAGARFKVGPDVLIPRPETEFLLEAVIQRVKLSGGSLVDVGTGSGILAISLARKFPEQSIYGIDISPAALDIARQNGEGVPNLQWLEGNLLDPLMEPHVQGIIANLPYIPSEVIPTLSREVQRDPRLALDGGLDGLSLILSLITQAAGRTNWIGLEIGEGQSGRVREAMIQAGFPEVEVIQDLRKCNRFIIGSIN